MEVKFTFSKIIILLLSLFSSAAFSQKTISKIDSVTTIVHIPLQNFSGQSSYKITSFLMRNIDTLGNVNYNFPKISEYEQDENGYYFKLNVPPAILNNSKEIWCKATLKPKGLYKSKDPKTEIEYGGVKLSKIKLIVKSIPEGAESFIVPNRIWDDKIKSLNKKNESILEKFRINTSATNTYAFVDETVYMVICKMGNKFVKTLHYTKPSSIEKEQIVTLNFKD